MVHMNHSELIGSRDVARHLGKSRATINRMVDAGTITPIGTIGKRGIRVFDRAEIEKLAREVEK